MKLIELIRIAAEGYRKELPESELLDFVNKRTGKPLPPEKRPGGDTLAQFVVVELAGTFDPGATDDEQLAEASRAIEWAADDLHNTFKRLDVERAKLADLEAQSELKTKRRPVL
jgi:hypothetical protein